MPNTIEFLKEERDLLTNLIIEYVKNNYNPQKLIDKKNYVEQLINKAIKQTVENDDSVEVDFNKSNLSVSEEDK